MSPETENQEVKIAYPGKPARHAYANPGRYFTQKSQCWFSRGTAHIWRTRDNSDVLFNSNRFLESIWVWGKTECLCCFDLRTVHLLKR